MNEDHLFTIGDLSRALMADILQDLDGSLRATEGLTAAAGALLASRCFRHSNKIKKSGIH